MDDFYPPPPQPTPGMQAALEVKAGSWIAAITWGFIFHLLKQGIAIDGKAYTLPFGQTVVIPIEPGFHVIEFFMRSPLRIWRGAHYRQFVHDTKVNLAPGMVQPLFYRMHRTTFGFFLNLKFTVLKHYDPKMIHSISYGAYAPSHGAYQGGHAPQPHFQQPSSYDHWSQTQATPPYASPFGESIPPVVTVPRPSVVGKKFCTQCGNEIIGGHRFCGGCGQPTDV